MVLAECLQQRGVPANPETILEKYGDRHIPDVMFDYHGLRCVIEGKMGDATNARAQVREDARQRVDIGIADIAVGVVYPGHLRTLPFEELFPLLNELEFDFSVHTENGPGGERRGRIDDILAELKNQYEAVVRDDVVERAVQILDEGMGMLARHIARSPGNTGRLMTLLGFDDLPQMKSTADQEKVRFTASQICALTITNALLFQSQLCWTDNRVKNMNDLMASKTLHLDLSQHWRLICDEINYVPIFRFAQDALNKLSGAHGLDDYLRDVVGSVTRIANMKAALRHDLIGRIYHKLLLEAKYLGTFYTSVAAASLLSRLCLAPRHWRTDWADVEQLKNFHVADLACGTGTLLIAASQSLADNYLRAAAAQGRKITVAELRELHQTLMENVIHGYDVQAAAVHLTASSLAMMAPEIGFRKMRLYILPLGKMEDGSIRLGSIDYLKEEKLSVQLSLLDEMEESKVGQVTSSGEAASSAPLPQLDLAIMNPPFVRSVGGNLLFGSIANREVLQKELKRVLGPWANSTAGLGSVFVGVADPYIKPGGRLALVLPAALTSGVAWHKTRDLIAAKYVLEYVVASHDPERWSFSENTDLSEVLAVARKKEHANNNNAKEESTVFINLWRNTRSPADAIAIGREILDCSPAVMGEAGAPEHGIESILLGDVKFAEVTAISWKELKNGPWLGAAFAQTPLLRAAWLLRQGKLVLPGEAKARKIPMCPLSELGKLGPDRRDIYDGFKMTAAKTPYPALWSHKAESMRSISLRTNSYLEPRTKAAEGRHLRKTSLLWPLAGKIMIAERMRFNTQGLFCVRLNKKALSNVWWPFVLHKRKDAFEKILALWLNSTLGIIEAAFLRVQTQGPWVQFKKPILLSMPVLNVLKLSPKRISALVSAYDEICDQELMPLSQMDRDPVRKKIDAAISRALGLPSIAVLSGLLASEPVICGRPLYADKPNAEDVA
ncbi:MAG TPA: hypothetical protein VM658_20525 [bacterium]|nr:hypothetical protein [bacterium]